MSSSAGSPGPDAADPVVIVGMALEAPGGIDTAAGYWSLLTEQREALEPISHRPRMVGARPVRRLPSRRIQAHS